MPPISCPHCGRSFDKQQAYAGHAKYCKPASQASASQQPADDPPDGSNTCGECGRVFSSKAGLSIHRRKVHPAEYNAALEDKAADRKNRTWTPQEVLLMANTELGLANRADMLDRLSETLGRSKYAVTGKRRSAEYQELLRSLSARGQCRSLQLGSPVRFVQQAVQAQRGSPGPVGGAVGGAVGSQTTPRSISQVDIADTPPRLVSGCGAVGGAAAEHDDDDVLVEQTPAELAVRLGGGEKMVPASPSSSDSSIVVSPTLIARMLQLRKAAARPTEPLQPVVIVNSPVGAELTDSSDDAVMCLDTDTDGQGTGDSESERRVSDGEIIPDDAASNHIVQGVLDVLAEPLPPTAEANVRGRVDAINRLHPFKEYFRTLAGSDDEIVRRVAGVAYLGAPTNDEVLSLVPPPKTELAGRGGQARQGRNPDYAPRGRGADRATEYRQCQLLWRRSRKTLAHRIFDNQGEPGNPPPVHEVEPAYRRIFEETGGIDVEPVRDRKALLSPVFVPFTADDIAGAVLRCSGGAPGPDGLVKRDLKTWSTEKLRLAFNIMLGYGTVPPSLLESRTTLIPKGGNPADLANWRPITVGSLVMRLFSRLLAGRLATSCQLDQNQRGFQPLDGTMANCVTLEAFLRYSRRTCKEHHVLSLDLRKAFDTVRHSSIFRSLERLGVEDEIVALVRTVYAGSTTRIKCGGGQFTPVIRFHRGVKQGDPLSPFLFSAVLDELLSGVDEMLGGEIVAGVRQPIIAFADDLVLVANSQNVAENLLRSTADFLFRRGLSLNTAKCSALSGRVVPRLKQIATVSEPLFRLNGQVIPQVNATDSFKYLGFHIGLYGMLKPTMASLQPALRRLITAPLKPAQKLEMLKTYLVPRYLYGLQNFRVTGRVLADFDRLIRMAVRRFMHFHRSSEDAFIHGPPKVGGLGVLSLSTLLPGVMGRRLRRVAEGGDRRLAMICDSPDVREIRRRLEVLDIAVTKGGYRTLWRDRVKQHPLLGGLTQAGDDAASNRWLREPPPFWSGREFVQAVKLRSSTLPTNGILSNPPGARRCRNDGCVVNETVCHILQRCPLVHDLRTRRHNHIVDIVRKTARRRGFNVTVERHLRLEDGTLRKPDLILSKEGEVTVCDVEVSWGDPSLAAAYRRKRGYYDTPLVRRAIAGAYGVAPDTIKFKPLIIGARGIWPGVNREVETLLTISRFQKHCIVSTVLQWGVTMHREFMRRGWRNR